MITVDRCSIARIAILLGGFLASGTGTARGQAMGGMSAWTPPGFGVAQAAPASGPAPRMIGDPWWDDAAPEVPSADPVAQPADPRLAGRQRAAARQRDLALGVLRRELSLVRSACPSLSPEQRAAVIAAGQRGVDEASKGDAATVRNLRVLAPGGAVRVEDGSATGPYDGARPVVDAVAQAVHAAATPEERHAFEGEVKARAERRRACALAILVEAVDQTAMLDHRQREALAVALDKNWQPLWDRVALQAGQSRITGRHLPPGVAAVVADVVGPEAFNAWQERLRRLERS